MRAVLYAGYDDANARLLLASAGISVVDDRPDVVVTYGGDGTFLRAEHAWPGVPKLILRASRICKLCPQLSNEEMARRFASDDYAVEELMQLEASIGEATFIGVNDIIVHNDNPRHAIRYHLSVDGKPIGHEIVGDGIVVATPLGSTGYYRSITDSFFELGIGIAFNNSTEQFDHMVLREDTTIEARIVRGPALVYADNKDAAATLHDGDIVTIRRADATARIIQFQ